MMTEKENTKITEREVAEAKEKYELLLEAFHYQNEKTIRLEKAPDDYRGDMCCVNILDNVTRERLPNTTTENETVYDIYKNRVYVGKLFVAYGNGGKSHKVAASSFSPAKGVKVIWGF